MRTALGSFELERKQAQERWDLENPSQPAALIQWAGGHLWKITTTHSRRVGYIDLTPAPEPVNTLLLPGFEIQGELL